MSIKMLMVFFLDIAIADLKKSISGKVMLHARNSYILQKSICKVTIINKDIEFQCNFFVVPGNGQAYLRMPDCERIQLLNINCDDTMISDLHGRQINENEEKIPKNKK